MVLLEDFGALIGLVFALFGVGMTLITGNGRWDAAGTAMIGVLLVVIAIILAIETKSLLLGEAADAEGPRRDRAGDHRGPRGGADHPHADAAPRPGGAAGGREDRGRAVRERPRSWPGASTPSRRGSGRPYRSPGSSTWSRTSTARRPTEAGTGAAAAPPYRSRHGTGGEAPAGPGADRGAAGGPDPGLRLGVAHGDRRAAGPAGRRAPGPEAELWLGAHPGAPATVDRDGGPVSLAELLAAEPEQLARRPAGRPVRHPAAVPAEGAGRRAAAVACRPTRTPSRPGRATRRSGRAGRRATTSTRTTSRSCWSRSSPFEALCGFRDPARVGGGARGVRRTGAGRRWWRRCAPGRRACARPYARC